MSTSSPGTSAAGTRSIASTPMVEIHILKKSYGFKPVLRGLDLTLYEGERMALLGANGTGKTTLLRILAGLTRATSGNIRIAGLDIGQHTQHIRHQIGFVAHQSYLYGELTALENLLFFGKMYAVAQAGDRARELLQCVGLERRTHERVSTFSRGQVQRLAWARALLHSPQLLLLDEPDTGLDQEGRELIEGLLREHSEQGGTILFTSHQLEHALQASDTVVVLANGRIVSQEQSATMTLDGLQRKNSEVAG